MEVGVVQLKKTANSPDSSVGFFRINHLEDYIVTHIERQMDLGNTISHDLFNNELWIKIGVSVLIYNCDTITGNESCVKTIKFLVSYATF